MKKEITIDDLALMVQKGFVGMEDRFDGLDKDVAVLKKDVSGLKVQVNNIENKVNQIDRRLFSIEEDVADIKIKQYGDLLKRVNFIESKLGIANA